MKIKKQFAPVLTQLLPRISLGVIAGIGVASYLLPQPSLAQTDSTQPVVDFQNQENKDPFSETQDGSSFSMLDLIHRAQLGNNSVDWSEYKSQQRQQLNNAATDFQRLQRERLRNLNSGTVNQALPTNNTQSPSRN